MMGYLAQAWYRRRVLILPQLGVPDFDIPRERPYPLLGVDEGGGGGQRGVGQG